MIQPITNLSMATNIQSTASKKDWLWAVVSITPLLPCFIFIPKLIAKHTLKFDWRWFRLYNPKKHNQRIKELYDIEII